MDYLLIIAAFASVIGAIFAAWRWNYARKAYVYQKRQLFIQVLMLAESREYWRMGKLPYIEKHDKESVNPNDISLKILDILNEVVPK